VTTNAAKNAPPPATIEAYDRLIATAAGVERKGASLPYTSVNGNMFSFMADGGLVALRLGRSDRAAFIERFATALHEAHGRVMAEYVTVPPGLLLDTGALAPWFAASVAYAKALGPKATTRRKKA
jgi:hypothetical protein